jgi:hypothetical protein
MTEGNLYHRRDGKRECLTCKKERNRGRKASVGVDAGDGIKSSWNSVGDKKTTPKDSRDILHNRKRESSLRGFVGKHSGQVRAAQKLAKVVTRSRSEVAPIPSGSVRGNGGIGARVDLLPASSKKREDESRLKKSPVVPEREHQERLGEEPSGKNEFAVRVCGFSAYNESDGETYKCGLPVHPEKVKHGSWVRV